MKLVGAQTQKKNKKLVQFLKGWDGPTTLRVEGECAFMLKIKILYILFCMCVYFLKNKGLITVWKCVFLKKILILTILKCVFWKYNFKKLPLKCIFKKNSNFKMCIL